MKAERTGLGCEGEVVSLKAKAEDRHQQDFKNEKFWKSETVLNSLKKNLYISLGQYAPPPSPLE